MKAEGSLQLQSRRFGPDRFAASPAAAGCGRASRRVAVLSVYDAGRRDAARRDETRKNTCRVWSRQSRPRGWSGRLGVGHVIRTAISLPATVGAVRSPREPRVEGGICESRRRADAVYQRHRVARVAAPGAPCSVLFGAIRKFCNSFSRATPPKCGVSPGPRAVIDNWTGRPQSWTSIERRCDGRGVSVQQRPAPPPRLKQLQAMSWSYAGSR